MYASPLHQACEQLGWQLHEQLLEQCGWQLCFWHRNCALPLLSDEKVNTDSHPSLARRSLRMLVED